MPDAPDAYINKNVKSPASGHIMSHPDAGRLSRLILPQTHVYAKDLLQESHTKEYYLLNTKEHSPPVRTEVFLPVRTDPFLPLGMDLLIISNDSYKASTQKRTLANDNNDAQVSKFKLSLHTKKH